MALWIDGRNDEAIAFLKAIPPTPPTNDTLAQIHASMGRYNDAAEVMEARAPNKDRVAEAVRLLRAAPAKVVSPPTNVSKGRTGWVYLYLGNPDRALDHIEVPIDAGMLGGPISPVLWAPAYAPVRKLPRFKALMRKAGLVDYWRERGWPDICHPVGNDDFACN